MRRRNRDVVRAQSGLPSGAAMRSRVQPFAPGQPIPAYVKPPGKPAEVNKLFRYVKPFTLVTEPEVVNVPVGRSTDPIPLPLDNKGSYQIDYSFLQIDTPAVSGAAPNDPQFFQLEILILDPDKRPFLMNNPISCRTICSVAGGTPFIWPRSMFMNVENAGKALFVSFRFIETGTALDPVGPVPVRFSLHGTRYYFMQAPRDVQEEIERRHWHSRVDSIPYFWTTERDMVLAATGDPNGNDTIQQRIRITDEADAEIYKVVKAALGVDQAEPSITLNPPFDLTLREKADTRFLMNGAISDTLVGRAEFPFLLFEPLFLEGNSQLEVEVTNPNAVPIRVWLTFAGRKMVHGQRRDPKPEQA